MYLGLNLGGFPSASHFNDNCPAKIQICRHGPPILLGGPASSHCDFPATQRQPLVCSAVSLAAASHSSLNWLRRGEYGEWTVHGLAHQPRKKRKRNLPTCLARHLPALLGFPFLRKSVRRREFLGKLLSSNKFLSENPD